jgi:hypothetical protein
MNSDNTINHWMIKGKVSGDTAESLWEDAKQYFMWCEQNPIYKDEIIKQTGAITAVAYPRPFNLAALCIHCGVTVGYINSIAKNKQAGEFHLVAQKILSVIYSQNLEYAMVGIYNANITAKKLNLGSDEEGGKAPAQINIQVIENGAPQLLENEQAADSKT